MNTKLVGLLVCTLLIITTIPVLGLAEPEHKNLKNIYVKNNFGLQINPIKSSGIDLSDWSGVYLDLQDTEEGIGDWQLSDDETMVTEILESDPCFFMSNTVSSKFEATFKCRVNTAVDDDYIGIVFGYNSPSEFYLLDWRSGDEEHYSGFTVKLIDAPSENDLLKDDFWTESGTQYTTILDSKIGEGYGWNEFENYTIYLLFDRGSFQLTVYNETGGQQYYLVINEGHYRSGRIGFYVNSQENVEFSAIEFIGSSNSYKLPNTSILVNKNLNLNLLQTSLRNLLGELPVFKNLFQ